VTVRILVVDNFDSFVHNLVHYLAELGADCQVRCNDDPALPDLGTGFDGVLVSPGPGGPHEAGASIEVVRACATAGTPLLGVCLGHQAIAAAYGGTIAPGPPLLHGTTSPVEHGGEGVLAGLPSPFAAARYNSLTVSRLPADLAVTARTPTGEVMALRHRELPIEGVQFHPEAVLSEYGHQLLATWLSRCGARIDPAHAAALDERYAAVRSAAGFRD
jgi:para-aminobenzoate synthetase component II